MNINKLAAILLAFIPLTIYVSVWTAWAVACYIYVLYDFFSKIRPMPIGEMAFLFSGFQWIISPLFAYLTGFEMSTPINLYMQKTGLMYTAFMFGYYGFRNDNTTVIDCSRSAIQRLEKLAKFFIVFGVICFYLQS